MHVSKDHVQWLWYWNVQSTVSPMVIVISFLHKYILCNVCIGRRLIMYRSLDMWLMAYCMLVWVLRKCCTSRDDWVWVYILSHLWRWLSLSRLLPGLDLPLSQCRTWTVCPLFARLTHRKFPRWAVQLERCTQKVLMDNIPLCCRLLTKLVEISAEISITWYV